LTKLARTAFMTAFPISQPFLVRTRASKASRKSSTGRLLAGTYVCVQCVHSVCTVCVCSVCTAEGRGGKQKGESNLAQKNIHLHLHTHTHTNTHTHTPRGSNGVSLC
jgi:hypothetical protein